MKHELLTLKNVGSATYEDLCKLGIDSIKELAEADPDELYARLQEITKQAHDPCVWDIFAAIIHEAKTGKAQSWWQWTKIRKARKKLNEAIEIGLERLARGQKIDGRVSYQKMKAKIKKAAQFQR